MLKNHILILDNTKYLDTTMPDNSTEVEIKEEFTNIRDSVRGKDMVENFIFDNKGLSEELYRVIGTN